MLRGSRSVRNTHDDSFWPLRGLVKAYISSTAASFRESIVNYIKAGLLACNISTVLPISIQQKQWTTRVKNFRLLTVAGQLAIYTQFPINPT